MLLWWDGESCRYLNAVFPSHDVRMERRRAARFRATVLLGWAVKVMQ